MVMEADEEILHLGGVLGLMIREDPTLGDLIEQVSIEPRDWTIGLTTGLLGKPNAGRWPALMQDMQLLMRDGEAEDRSLTLRLPIEVERAASDVKLVPTNFRENDLPDLLDRSIRYFTSRKQLKVIRDSREAIRAAILEHADGEAILASLSPRQKIRSLL